VVSAGLPCLVPVPRMHGNKRQWPASHRQQSGGHGRRPLVKRFAGMKMPTEFLCHWPALDQHRRHTCLWRRLSATRAPLSVRLPHSPPDGWTTNDMSPPPPISQNGSTARWPQIRARIWAMDILSQVQAQEIGAAWAYARGAMLDPRSFSLLHGRDRHVGNDSTGFTSHGSATVCARLHEASAGCTISTKSHNTRLQLEPSPRTHPCGTSLQNSTRANCPRFFQILWISTHNPSRNDAVRHTFI
jgi:hypothetical protein